jgi:hypothetical protein
MKRDVGRIKLSDVAAGAIVLRRTYTFVDDYVGGSVLTGVARTALKAVMRPVFEMKLIQISVDFYVSGPTSNRTSIFILAIAALPATPGDGSRER